LSIFLVVLSPESLQSIVQVNTQILPDVLLDSHVVMLPDLVLTQSTRRFDYLLLVYILGGLVVLGLFIKRLAILYKLINSNKRIEYKDYILVRLPEAKQVFSFYQYIFISEDVAPANYDILIKHELVHIKQKHSFDLIFFELMKIVFWFNPLVYIYQKQLQALHEFIADAESLKNIDNNTYYNHLLNDLFQVENIAFVNQFFHQSLLKNRLIMMTKNKSKKWKSLKYIFIFPLVLAMMSVAYDINAQDQVSQEPLIIQNVDTPPIYPGCEGESKEDLKSCFSKNVIGLVSRKFNAGIANDLGLPSGKQRINVQFIIDKEGHVVDIQARAKHKKLEAEAVRVAQLLPKMTPAKDGGNSVSIKYFLPIVFEVVDDKDDTFTLEKVEIPPVFPGCEGQNKMEQKKCFTKKTMEFVAEHFDSKLAEKLKLPTGKKRIVVQYVIDETGHVKDIVAKAPHAKLEEEAIRVVKKMPKFTPAMSQGQPTKVSFSLPIIFEVNDEPSKK
jgi:beta-lactamase regulating signal transducer with metallopeptidase domain/peroxiredoxin